MEERSRFVHTVIGPVHEVEPLDTSAGALAAALRHESEDCHAVRVVVDLADQPDVEAAQVDVIIELIDPDDERWVVRLPEGVDDAVVERLYEAGLDGRLIDDTDGDLPHHVDRPHHEEPGH